MFESSYKEIKYSIQKEPDENFGGFIGMAGFGTKNFFQVCGDSFKECQLKIQNIIDVITNDGGNNDY